MLLQTTNRIGNVPAYFYDDLPHIGYDMDGKKVMRPATGDELDKFLEGVEDADGGWYVSLRPLAENAQLTVCASQDDRQGQASPEERRSHRGGARPHSPTGEEREPRRQLRPVRRLPSSLPRSR